MYEQNKFNQVIIETIQNKFLELKNTMNWKVKESFKSDLTMQKKQSHLKERTFEIIHSEEQKERKKNKVWK